MNGKSEKILRNKQDFSPFISTISQLWLQTGKNVPENFRYNKTGNDSPAHNPRLGMLWLSFRLNDLSIYLSISKGQIISKCPFGVKTSSKKPMKFFPGFLP